MIRKDTNRSDVVRKNIKRLIKEQETTNSKVAKKMNISRQGFQKYLSDDYEISDEIMENVATALEVPVSELLNSERKNARNKYVKARQEYYATKGGKEVSLFIAALILSVCVIFNRLSIYIVGLVAFMFLGDFTGLLIRLTDPVKYRLLRSKWVLYLYRIIAAILILIFVVLPEIRV